LRLQIRLTRLTSPGEAAHGQVYAQTLSEVRDRSYTAGNPFDALIVGCYDGRDLKYVGTVRNGLVPHIRCALCPGCGNSRRRNVRLLIFPRSGERFIRLPRSPQLTRMIMIMFGRWLFSQTRSSKLGWKQIWKRLGQIPAFTRNFGRQLTANQWVRRSFQIGRKSSFRLGK
jgi:hypothetical protein